MASDSIDYPVDELLDNSDFTLEQSEVSKGQQALRDFLSAVKGSDVQQATQDNLNTLAVLISGGACDAGEFPWHQVRPHHSAAALSILREEGVPARIESWRCRLDDTRKFHQVPKRYTPGQVQKIATSLHRVLKQCQNLGYLSEEECSTAIQPSLVHKTAPPRTRLLTEGEFRALASACNLDTTTAGCRDALVMYLGFQAGLRPGEIAAVAVKDLHFDSRRGQSTVRVREAGKSRARVVPMQNEALISLEDWMELRGSADGPLLCPIRRGRLDVKKRLTVAAIKEICDQRAKQSGVAPFAPAELRKSWELRVRARRRQSVERSVEAAEPSPLFSADEAPEHGTAKIQFPYLTRSELIS